LAVAAVISSLLITRPHAAITASPRAIRWASGRSHDHQQTLRQPQDRSVARVAAPRHFVSDVIVGAAAGTSRLAKVRRPVARIMGRFTTRAGEFNDGVYKLEEGFEEELEFVGSSDASMPSR
jgi:hypothetical protein